MRELRQQERASLKFVRLMKISSITVVVHGFFLLHIVASGVM